MKFSEAKAGRVFVIRLEDGDILHEEIERFAAENEIRAATLTAVGGVDAGSCLIVGQRHDFPRRGGSFHSSYASRLRAWRSNHYRLRAPRRKSLAHPRGCADGVDRDLRFALL